jgi:hypothetical protein
MRLAEQNGSAIHLDRRLGGGGEGDIFAVAGNPSIVAKIYFVQKSDRVEKLLAMVSNPPVDPTSGLGHVSICWPKMLLFSSSRECVGFGMHRVDVSKNVPVLELYNPAARRQVAPEFTWGYLLGTAANISSVVEAIHACNCVVGDLNESNFLVSNRALVTLVDCDSIQVPNAQTGRYFRCGVGKADFTPPELQGSDFSRIDRSRIHDNFALGVMIWMLLMEGIHPYAGVWNGRNDPPPLEDRIRAGDFSCSNSSKVSPMPAALPFDFLPAALRSLFARCFVDGHSDPAARPSPREWTAALTSLSGHLRTCSRNSRHVHPNHLAKCPWCDRTILLSGFDPFPSVSQQRPLKTTSFVATRLATNTVARTQSPQFPAPPQALPYVNPKPKAGHPVAIAIGVLFFVFFVLPPLIRLFIPVPTVPLGFGLVSTCGEVRGWHNITTKNEFKAGESVCGYAEATNIGKNNRIDASYTFTLVGPDHVTYATQTVPCVLNGTSATACGGNTRDLKLPANAPGGTYTMQVSVRDNLTGQTGNSSANFHVLADIQKPAELTIAGIWQGTFSTSGNDTNFNLTIQQSEINLTGEASEKDLSGQDVVSDISGVVQGTSIKFDKKYRSNGTKISYTGTLQPDGLTITGQWTNDVRTGEWRISRISQTTQLLDPTTVQGAASSNPGQSFAIPGPIVDASSAQGINALLSQWTDSLRRRDLEAQINCYAPQLEHYFKKNDVSREAVRADKALALSRFSALKVNLTDVKIVQLTPDRATVEFNKSWDFERDSGKAFVGQGQEQLAVTKGPVGWVIVSELESQATLENAGEVSGQMQSTPQIQPGVGRVGIQSVPAATIFVDGSQRGTTDGQGYLQIYDLPSGPHKFLVKKTGYQDLSSDVTVPAGQTAAFDAHLQMALGKLTIQTLPDAEILIDGLNRGVADGQGKFAATDLAVGTHAIAVRRTGYAIGQYSVDLGPGENKELRATPDLIVGFLTLRSNRPRTAFQVSESMKFSDSITDNPFPPGTYNISASLAGMKTETRTVVVTVGQHTLADFALVPDPDYLRIRIVTAKNLLARGDVQAAIQGANEILAESPANGEALGIIASAYFRSRDYAHFETAAIDALHRGGSVSINLMHEHTGMSGDSVHPATITLTSTTIEYDPGSSPCKYPHFTALLAGVGTVEVTDKSVEGKVIGIVVRHLAQGTVLLHLEMSENKSNETAKMYFGTPDSYTVKNSNGVNYLASHSNSSQVLGPVANVIRRALADAKRR